MAKSKARAGRSGRWLNHGSLVLSEAVLAAGLLQELLENWVLAETSIPPLLRVVAAVAVSLGTLGGLMVAVQARLRAWIDGTHDALTSRLPLPSVLAHAGILLALFAGYCWLWDEQTGALGALWRWLAAFAPGWLG